MRAILLLLGAALISVPFGAAAQNSRVEHRIAAESCVWGYVQARLESGAAADTIDRQFAIGAGAVSACVKQIDNWARQSPAVLESGENPDDVALRIANHLTARGALFAEGVAEPFYWSAEDRTREHSTSNAALPAPLPLPRNDND